MWPCIRGGSSVRIALCGTLADAMGSGIALALGVCVRIALCEGGGMSE